MWEVGTTFGYKMFYAPLSADAHESVLVMCTCV